MKSHLQKSPKITKNRKKVLVGTTSVKEIDYNERKRIDINIEKFLGDKDLGIEISIIDARCGSYIDKEEGKALEQVGKNKTKKYARFYDSHLLATFIMDCMGKWGNDANQVFQKLIHTLHSVDSLIPIENLSYYWKSRIAMSMHKSASKGCLDRYMDCQGKQCHWIKHYIDWKYLTTASFKTSSFRRVLTIFLVNT